MYKVFSGNTRMEVITAIARCGSKPSDADFIVSAVKLYVGSKQEKGRNQAYIIEKLEDVENRFKEDAFVCAAFRKARRELQLPRSNIIPPPSRSSQGSNESASLSPTTPHHASASDGSSVAGVSSTPSMSRAKLDSIEEWRARAKEPVPDRREPSPEEDEKAWGHMPLPLPRTYVMRRSARSRGRSRDGALSGDEFSAASASETDGEGFSSLRRYQPRLAVRDEMLPPPVPVQYARRVKTRRASVDATRPHEDDDRRGQFFMPPHEEVGRWPLESVLHEQIGIVSLSPSPLPPLPPSPQDQAALPRTPTTPLSAREEWGYRPPGPATLTTAPELTAAASSG